MATSFPLMILNSTSVANSALLSLPKSTANLETMMLFPCAWTSVFSVVLGGAAVASPDIFARLWMMWSRHSLTLYRAAICAH